MSYLLDANILLYTANANAPKHQQCFDWLMTTLTKGDTVYVTDLIEVALLRIATLPSLKNRAATIKDVFNFLEDLHGLANYQHISQSELTRGLWQSLCTRYTLQGNHVNDAYLAALAIEHKLSLVSADKGFARFSELSWIDPTVL